MVRLARRHVPGARFAVGRLPAASMPACDAVVAVGEVLNYMKRAAAFDALFLRVCRALYRRADETHRLTLLPAAELSRRLRAAGFRVRVARGYGDFRLPPGHAVLIARKPNARTAPRRFATGSGRLLRSRRGARGSAQRRDFPDARA